MMHSEVYWNEADDFLLRFFKYEHLPKHLQAVSKPFSELAMHVRTTIPFSEERHQALRRLLEGKDCAVRACLP